MLTAAGELDQIVEGLALGADDYLAKPFDFQELRPGCRRSGAGRGAACRRSWRAATSS